MIVFLTLCYVGVLFLLVKIGVIKKLTPIWGLSIIAWFLLLNVVLFIPMQFYAPKGEVRVFRYVIQIVPLVGGRVTEVPVKPNVPVKKGDVLFKIDPTTYQAEVDRLTAQVADARRQVTQLKEAAKAAEAVVAGTIQEVEIARSTHDAAKAEVEAAKASVAEAKAGLDAATADVSSQKTQVALAESRLTRLKQLVQTDAAARDELEEGTRQVEIVKGKLSVTEKVLVQAREKVTQTEATLEKAKASEVSASRRVTQLIETEIPRVESQARQARAAADAEIEGEHPLVAGLLAQLDKAEFNLKETIMRAPTDGFVVNLQLRPGSRVGSLPLAPVMTFVASADTLLTVEIPQNQLRHIQPGQQAEVTLPLYPGRTITAEVEMIVAASGQGQLTPSGDIPTTLGTEAGRSGFAVRLKLPEDFDAASLPTGAGGTAAVYTDKGKPTHIIRRVMIRMEAWLNYIF